MIDWAGRDAADLADRSIFHVTRLGNLASIISAGGVLADAECERRGISVENLGLRNIKDRRRRRRVTAGAGGMLGDYVPFNFCPRSVFLHRCSIGHDDYQGGDGELIHLRSTIRVAIGTGRAWAFSDRHAEVGQAQHYSDPAQLGMVPWTVMPLTYWREHRELRQAEFLVHQQVPWSAVLQIGCKSREVAERVRAVLGEDLAPAVDVMARWYY